tara:strand:- start:4368 stop:4535 length:168 start_codon:yes stop_codon:yes gene_type:complete
MVKSRRIIKKEIEYYDTCKICKKEIKGSTENQVRYNLDIHVKSCKEKIKFLKAKK